MSYEPHVPTYLRALSSHVLYVSECLRAFASYVPSFFQRVLCALIFLRVLRAFIFLRTLRIFIFDVPNVPSFFRALSAFIFYVPYVTLFL